MPITLACPSCSKRFRARDESAGKRVKCPFCQAAVPVPAADDVPAPAEAVAPPAPSLFAPPPSRPPAPSPLFQSQSQSSPASTDDPPLFDIIGKPAPPAPPAAAAPVRGPAAASPPRKPVAIEDDVPLFAVKDPIPKPGKPRKELVVEEPAKGKAGKGGKAARPAASPEEVAVGAWRKTKGGLGWVQFGLLLFALVGMVPFAKLVYERTQGPLPAGDGAEWVKLDGYINTTGADVVTLSKTELLEVAGYGLPVLLGGLAVVLGRLTAGAVPRVSGAKGLFLCGGLLTLVALAGGVTWVVSQHVRAFPAAQEYGWLALVVGGVVAEFWFLLGLGAVAATVRRPRAVKGVGSYAFVLGLGAVAVLVGWPEYLKHAPEQLGRPTPLDPDWKFYEAGAKMLGWLVVVGSYWRAISGVKGAIKDQMRSLREAGKGDE